jgi:RimJ/RimL family protein N-acetyltransferase
MIPAIRSWSTQVGQVVQMRTEIKIEPAGAADAERILQLQKLAYQSEARLYNDWSIPPLTESIAAMTMAIEDWRVLKAHSGADLVGAVRARFANDACEVGRLIVHPDHQGQGIGRRLMHAIEREFPLAARFELFTGSRSQRNIGLYRSLGYRQFRSESKSPDLTLVFMEKFRAQAMLQTERLFLRPAAAGDLDQLAVMWNDPEVRRFLFDDQGVTRELAGSVLEWCLSCAPSGYGLWLLHTKESQALIGCAGLLPTKAAAECEPRLKGMLELLALLMPTYWRRGYAREALDELIRHGFDVLGEPRLAGAHDAPNVASERMLRALGFTHYSEVPGPKYRLRTYVLERAQRRR